ncbi:hypothetical protein [Nocardia sp. A7]
MLPQRTPETERPYPTNVAPPSVIRRLLAALDAWPTNKQTS